MTDLKGAPFRDSSRPIRERVSDILSRMTLPEKAAQMVCMWNLKKETLVDESGRFDPAKAAKDMDLARLAGRATSEA